jgi:hypothetical protein
MQLPQNGNAHRAGARIQISNSPDYCTDDVTCQHHDELKQAIELEADTEIDAQSGGAELLADEGSAS